jgi:SAM-dependent methyltransferase
MREQEYDWMARLEQDFWWYRGMRRLTLALSQDIPRADVLKCFDAGCGTGFNLQWYPSWIPSGWFAGMDLSAKALHWCCSRGLNNLLRGDVSRLPIRDESLDLVTCFDILQHLPGLPEVEQAVAEYFRALRPGGWLILRVAAYNFLKSRHDEAILARNRFTATYIRQLLGRSGFEIRRDSYVNTILFPIAALRRLIDRGRSGEAISDVRPVPEWMDRFLFSCLAGEAWLLERGLTFFPFGLSYVCVSRKPL